MAWNLLHGKKNTRTDLSSPNFCQYWPICSLFLFRAGWMGTCTSGMPQMPLGFSQQSPKAEMFSRHDTSPSQAHVSQPCLIMVFVATPLGVWRDGSGVKGLYSSRGPKFHSQHPCPVPEDLMLPASSLMQTHMYMIKNKSLKQPAPNPTNPLRVWG